MPSLHRMNEQFFIDIIDALFFVDISTPATPWSRNIDYFRIIFPPLEKMPIVPPPPLIYDLFTIKEPSFSTTMQGNVIWRLWYAAKDILH